MNTFYKRMICMFVIHCETYIFIIHYQISFSVYYNNINGRLELLLRNILVFLPWHLSIYLRSIFIFVCLSSFFFCYFWVYVFILVLWFVGIFFFSQTNQTHFHLIILSLFSFLCMIGVSMKRIFCCCWSTEKGNP